MTEPHGHFNGPRMRRTTQVQLFVLCQFALLAAIRPGFASENTQLQQPAAKTALGKLSRKLRSGSLIVAGSYVFGSTAGVATVGAGAIVAGKYSEDKSRLLGMASGHANFVQANLDGGKRPQDEGLPLWRRLANRVGAGGRLGPVFVSHYPQIDRTVIGVGVPMIGYVFAGRDLAGVQLFSLPFELLGADALGLLTGEVPLARLRELVFLKPISSKSLIVAYKHPSIRLVPQRWIDRADVFRTRYRMNVGRLIDRWSSKGGRDTKR